MISKVECLLSFQIYESIYCHAKKRTGVVLMKLSKWAPAMGQYIFMKLSTNAFDIRIFFFLRLSRRFRQHCPSNKVKRYLLKKNSYKFWLLG